MTLRQAAQQALNDICGAKLCEINSMSSRVEMLRLMDSAITALRAALAEPEQEPQTTHWEGCEAVHPECRKPEPVAWIFVDDTGMKFVSVDRPHKDFQPLYTSAPTPRKPLTDEEIALISGECAASAYRHDDFSFARAVIAAYEKKQGEQT